MFKGQRYFIKKPIALIGFMGSGKSSVAQLLEKHTGIKHVDTDKLVVQKTMQAVSEIINNQGEDAFRKLEAQVLEDVVEKEKCIIATGGGCVESAVSRGILKDCFTVWLEVDADTAEARIEDLAERPMFKDIDNANNILLKRNEIYKQYSNVSVDTNGKSLSAVVKEVFDILIKRGIIRY